MKRWLAILIAGVGFILVLVLILALVSGTDYTKFEVGKPLPAGKVAPQLVVGYSDQAVLLAPDGTLWMWGGTPSQPGIPFFAVGRSGVSGALALTPNPQRLSEDTDWRQVASASAGVVATKSDGTMWTWGTGWSGTTSKASVPGKLPPPVQMGTESNWMQVSGLISFFMALKADGSLWCWGQNESGQLGNGITNRTMVMAQVAFAPTQVGTNHDWKAISAGAFNGYALKQDGTLWGWGSQIDQGTNQIKMNVYSPEQIDPDTNWVAISAGDFHVIGLKTDGTIWVRGHNAHLTAPAIYPQSRQGGVPKDKMAQIGKDEDWDRVCSGQNCFFARKKDGTWWACGSDSAWQLGVDNPAKPIAGGVTAVGGGGGAFSPGHKVASPTRLPLDVEPWAFATGGLTTLMLTKDGRLWSWGTRLGVSKSALEARGIKGLYKKAVTWWQTKVRKKTEATAQTQGQSGRRGGGGLPSPGLAVADSVTDFSPYRIWDLPASMQKALEKNAAKATDGRKDTPRQ